MIEIHPKVLCLVLSDLGRLIVSINAQNGWNVATPDSWEEENKIPAVIALIHSELSEALEAFRHGDRENFEEELADVVIRLLDLTSGLGINLGPVILDKLQKNRTRGYRHGGKRV